MIPATRENPIPPTANRFAIDLFEWPATTIATCNTVPTIVAIRSARELSMCRPKWGEYREEGRSSTTSVLQSIHVVTEHSYGVVEGVERAIGARDHHTAFYRGQSEHRESAAVDVRRQTIARFDEALLDRIEPSDKIRSEKPANRGIRLVQLEGNASDRTAVRALCGPVSYTHLTL